MDHDVIAVIALGISAVIFAFNIFDRIWGGGGRSASLAPKEYVDLQIAALRRDAFLKHDETAGNVGQSLIALKDLAHKAEIAALEFRAFVAENYMRRDSYYKAMGELKADVNEAFQKIDKRLERMENANSRRDGG